MYGNCVAKAADEGRGVLKFDCSDTMYLPIFFLASGIEDVKKSDLLVDYTLLAV